MMIANFLYIIPSAVAQSLFAEGSYSETELKVHLKKAVKIISLILVPAIIATVFFGKYILLVFGKQYSSEGIVFLQLLAISGIFLSINYLGNTVFYIKHKIKSVFLINLAGAFVIISLSTLLMSHDLFGIGIAWLIGQGVTTLFYLSTLNKLNCVFK